MADKNYIIGRAEELTSLIPPPKIKPNTDSIYTLTEVITRLKPQLDRVVEDMKENQSSRSAGGYAVARMTMHPSYISKGHFPQKLLRSADFSSIGSKGVKVKPDKWTRKGEPKESPSTSIFIAGKVSDFEYLKKRIEILNADDYLADDLMHVWSFDTIFPEEKVKLHHNYEGDHFEVVLHLIPEVDNEYIENNFHVYADKIGFEIAKEHIISVSNLLFIPLSGNKHSLHKLAEYPFVRVIREIPKLRSYKPLVTRMAVTESPELPNEPAIAQDIKVAILDGGLTDDCVMNPWINSYYLSNPSAGDDTEAVVHGATVTSAFLFGSIDPDLPLQRPFSPVDHYRVIDNEIGSESPYELYKILGHIEEVLISNQYDFINLSLGPEFPVDDDEVHPWTSLIDSHLYESDTFLCIAAGNNGDGNEELGLNRIQVPADSVNGLSVGSANSRAENWLRAKYSAIGPGRSPGWIKPDLLDFGGDNKDYFHVLDHLNPASIIPQLGTSYASPYLLRKAVGIRALMGKGISPVAIKAMLINSAQSNGTPQLEIGWGRVPDDIESLIESPSGTARILYQGELTPGKYMKAPLPIPKAGLNGQVTIRATCCFITPVDPQDSSVYTKAGVEISWCPNSSKNKKETFFQQQKRASEAELRRDAAKWETTLHNQIKKNPKSLDEPYFEIHYMARDSGASVSAQKAKPVKYAFVITLECPKHGEIFTEILNDYKVLTEIKPRVQLPTKINV